VRDRTAPNKERNQHNEQKTDCGWLTGIDATAAMEGTERQMDEGRDKTAVN